MEKDVSIKIRVKLINILKISFKIETQVLHRRNSFMSALRGDCFLRLC